MQEKIKWAQTTLKSSTAAAAGKALSDSLVGRIIDLPDDHHDELSPISSLLTPEENAALNQERYKNGACVRVCVVGDGRGACRPVCVVVVSCI